MKRVAATANKFNAKSSGFNLRPSLPIGLFRHPAPASTSVHLTPTAFLPKSDPRASSAEYAPEGAAGALASAGAPAIYTTPVARAYALTPADVAEAQRLRDQGVPRSAIANQFKIANHFVGVITTPNAQTVKATAQAVKRTKSRWSRARANADELRRRREAQWTHL